MYSLLREMNMKYQHVDDKRMEGLRALARMIAAAHIRRLRDAERAEGQCTVSTDLPQSDPSRKGGNAISQMRHRGPRLRGGDTSGNT
jgi:hypothetical protein